MKRFVVAFVATLLLLGTGTADAAWTTGAGGSGTASAQSVGVPTSVTATALTYSSVKVSWSAPASGPTPAQYVVLRTAPTSATVCTVSSPTATCTDTGLAGSTSYSYTVTSLLGTSWASGPSPTASATTPAGPTFKLTTTGGNKTAGTAFAVTITATTNGTTTDTSFAGVKSLSFSGPGNAPSGTAPTYPATVSFTAGVGSASVTLVNAETVNLAATDGTRSGSVAVTVVAGTAAKLGWSSSTPSCASGTINVGVGGAFTSKVTAYDTYLNPKTGSRTVNLSRSPALGSLSVTSLGITAANSETTSSFTYTRPGGGNNITVTAASSGLTSVTCAVNQ